MVNGPYRLQTILAAREPGECLEACENFLYGFKAASRAARAANTARTPTLPLRRRQRRSAGAKIRNPGPPLTYSSHRGSAAGEWCPCSRYRYCPGRAEPVKSAYGVGFADLRLLTEPARQSRSSQAVVAMAGSGSLMAGSGSLSVVPPVGDTILGRRAL